MSSKKGLEVFAAELRTIYQWLAEWDRRPAPFYSER
jgi:hypothetical protein